MNERLRSTKVRITIHTASVAAAGVGAGLAQLPCSDMVPLSIIQTSMIGAIALAHGRKLTEATVASLLSVFAASVVGRAASQVLVGWFPGVGNVVNAASAMAITTAIGWYADNFFENLPPNVSENELRRMAERR